MSGPFVTNYGSAAVITPSDTVNAGFSCLYIGGTGNVTVIMEGGESCLFSAIPVGTLLPIRGKRVQATGTTATLIVGMN